MPTSYDFAITVRTPNRRHDDPSVLAAVRTATELTHARIEASPHMQRLVCDDYTEREYRLHLGRMLGFYEPFEAALVEAGAGIVAPFSASRRGRLEYDLADLGLTAGQLRALPRCGNLKLSPAGLLGGLYVYEGAALGGQIIARRLRRSLGETHRSAFYHADAAQTGSQWKAFCQHLQTSAPVCVEAVCAAAVAAFDAFADWFDCQPSNDVPARDRA